MVSSDSSTQIILQSILLQFQGFHRQTHSRTKKSNEKLFHITETNRLSDHENLRWAAVSDWMILGIRFLVLEKPLEKHFGENQDSTFFWPRK